MSKKTSILSFLFCILLYPTSGLWAQKNTQNIRGVVTDKLTQLPIAGATVEIVTKGTGTTCDTQGHFILSNLMPDRYELRISSVGYKVQVIPNVVLNSGKEVILDIQLDENFKQIKEVIIKSNNKGLSLNKLASVSTKTFTMEEVSRYAGGRSDPARLVANFAGVSAPDDSRNDIVIRGNSPIGVLWRIDGMTVSNPNHFASVGTTGGAVSALNTNLLKNADFFTSAFPAEYGNATAGVFDLGFRNGNNKKRETTFQAGVITGLEATTEGPFSKKSDASYLVGYRYALAGIAQKLGVNIGTTATPSYQDLSFKLNSGKTAFGTFSMFGILASSTIEIGGGNTNTLYGNGNQVDFTSKIGILGLNHRISLNSKSYLLSTIGLNYSSNHQTGYDFDRPTNTSFIHEENEVAKTGNNISITYHNKVNARLFIKAGIQDELMHLNLLYQSKNRIVDDFNTLWDFTGRTQLVQSFIHMKYLLSEKLTLNTGLHAQYFTLNATKAIEPRVGLIYQVNAKSSLNFGYGLHGQLQPINVYFLQSKDGNGNTVYNNKNLDFTRSHHIVMGYNFQLKTDWRIKSEIYYQSLFNVPITTHSSSFSMLNTGSSFKPEFQDSLTNAGTGKNYGIELTIEKYFSQGYYGLLTGSIYRSRYTGSDLVERNTAFNGRYVANALAGKEWKVGKTKINKFSADIKCTYAGGRAYTPTDLATSQLIGREVLSNEAYSAYYTNYYRIDLKGSYTINSRKYKLSHSIAIDLQNITNHKNIFSTSYDNRKQEISTTYQLGFFPNLVYRLQW